MLRDLPMTPVANGHAAKGLVPFSVSQARKEAALAMLEAELVVELPGTPLAMNGYAAVNGLMTFATSWSASARLRAGNAGRGDVHDEAVRRGDAALGVRAMFQRGEERVQ